MCIIYVMYLVNKLSLSNTVVVGVATVTYPCANVSPFLQQ